TPVGRLRFEASGEGVGAGLLELAGRELESRVEPTLEFGRRLACAYVQALCEREEDDASERVEPGPGRLEALLAGMPPMRGAEYASVETLESAWFEIDEEVRRRRRGGGGDRQEFVHGLHPHWNSIGRVTFHLAERRRDEERPFAFLATYTAGLTAAGKPRHVPLERALEEHRGDRSALLNLLRPVEAAAAASAFARELVESGDVYRPIAWTAEQAWRFLVAVPALQEAGVIVRLPAGALTRSARPVVTTTV